MSEKNIENLAYQLWLADGSKDGESIVDYGFGPKPVKEYHWLIALFLNKCNLGLKQVYTYSPTPCLPWIDLGSITLDSTDVPPYIQIPYTPVPYTPTSGSIWPDIISDSIAIPMNETATIENTTYWLPPETHCENVQSNVAVFDNKKEYSKNTGRKTRTKKSAKPKNAE